MTRGRWIAVTALLAALVAGGSLWLTNARVIDGWLAIHTGTENESGVYYAFWSGFGSDLAELGIIGAAGTAVYQMVRKYNCHEPGCWRIGKHPAAGGQFLLCYRHHPDYRGRRPSRELILQLHREHQIRQLRASEWVEAATVPSGPEQSDASGSADRDR